MINRRFTIVPPASPVCSHIETLPQQATDNPCLLLEMANISVSLYPAAEGLRFGMPLMRLVRMGFNVAIDIVLGANPLIRDLFDFAWRSSRKNVRLVLDHIESNRVAERVTSS